MTTPNSQHRLDFVGAMRRVQDTPQGGILSPAYLTRTGVFTYHYTDGSTVRELRHPDDVFSQDSLATLAGAPVTVGHPSDPVTADNWRALAVGTVADRVKVKDSKFVAAKTRVQDKATVEAIKRGDLAELSCGYTATIADEKGTYEGEEYDCRQKDIRYNHVALGPVGWGRAGSDVGLKLDGGAYTKGMKLAVTRHDNAAAPAADPAAPKPAPVVVAGVSQSEYDKVCGELAAERAARATAEAKVPTAQALDSLVNERLELHTAARKVLPADVKLDGKSAHEIRTLVCNAAAPSVKLDGKSEDFVRGMFETVTAKENAAAAATANLNVKTVVKADGTEVDPIQAARARSDARALNAHKAPVVNGKN